MACPWRKRRERQSSIGSSDLPHNTFKKGLQFSAPSANVKKKMDKRNDCMRRRGDRKMMEDIVRRKKRSPGRGPGR